MKKFSFNKAKKITFPVELPWGETIALKEPRKKDVDVLDGSMQSEDIDEIYNGLAMLLSNNVEGREFTVSELEDFPIQDVYAFLSAYTDFLTDSLPKN